MLQFKAIYRGTDAYGSGEYGAPRGDHTHRGVDLAIAVTSPVQGEVTKLGYCYSDDLSYRYVQVTDSKGYDIRMFYVEPSVEEGDHVNIGSRVGVPQSLQRRYPGITDHVHLEVRRADGSYLSWNEYIDARYRG